MVLKLPAEKTMAQIHALFITFAYYLILVYAIMNIIKYQNTLTVNMQSGLIFARDATLIFRLEYNIFFVDKEREAV